MRRALLAGVAAGFLLSVSLPSQDQSSPFDLERVQVGSQAPDFTLAAADGTSVTLSRLRGKNVLLVFYRGYW